MGKLAQAIASRHLDDLRDDDRITDKGTTKFDKLPTVAKNTTPLFSVIDGQDDADLEVLQPTQNFLAILRQKAGTAVRDLLHHEMRQAGLRACLQMGMCTTLKNGCIASVPSPTSINQLNPFYCPPEADEKLSTHTIMRLTE